MNKKIYVLCTSAVTLLDRVRIRDVVKKHFNNVSDLIYVPKLDNKQYLKIQDATHILVACSGKDQLNKLMFMKDFTVRSSCAKFYANRTIATINPNSLEIRNIHKVSNSQYEIGLVTDRFLDNLIGSVTSTKPKDLNSRWNTSRLLRTDSLNESSNTCNEIKISGCHDLWVRNEKSHSTKYDAEILHKTLSELQNMSYSTISTASAFDLDLQKRTANVTTYDNKRLNFDLKLLLF